MGSKWNIHVINNFCHSRVIIIKTAHTFRVAMATHSVAMTTHRAAMTTHRGCYDYLDTLCRGEGH